MKTYIGLGLGLLAVSVVTTRAILKSKVAEVMEEATVSPIAEHLDAFTKLHDLAVAGDVEGVYNCYVVAAAAWEAAGFNAIRTFDDQLSLSTANAGVVFEIVESHSV